MRKRVPRAVVHLLATVLLGIAARADVPAQEAVAGGDHRSIALSFHGDGAIRVEAERASLSDIIGELSRAVGFEIDWDAPNEDVRMTRRLEGTLDELLAKLLRDGNYLLITDAGVPKRLIVLPAGRAAAPPSDSSRSQAQGAISGAVPGAMSIQQLRQKEDELLVQIARYEDMSDEAREHANPELTRRFKSYAQKLSRDVDAIRARLSAAASNMR